MTSVLSASTTRKTPSISPAFGPSHSCSATRGPHSPRQRPSSHAKLSSAGLETIAAEPPAWSGEGAWVSWACAALGELLCARTAFDDPTQMGNRPKTNTSATLVLVRVINVLLAGSVL